MLFFIHGRLYFLEIGEAVTFVEYPARLEVFPVTAGTYSAFVAWARTAAGDVGDTVDAVSLSKEDDGVFHDFSSFMVSSNS